MDYDPRLEHPLSERFPARRGSAHPVISAKRFAARGHMPPTLFRPFQPR